jgi:hypothetical protein
MKELFEELENMVKEVIDHGIEQDERNKSYFKTRKDQDEFGRALQLVKVKERKRMEKELAKYSKTPLDPPKDKENASA